MVAREDLIKGTREYIKGLYGKVLVSAHTLPSPPQQAWGPGGNAEFRVWYIKCVANAYFFAYRG